MRVENASYDPNRASHSLLHPVQFQHVETEATHRINALEKNTGRPVGFMEWSKKSLQQTGGLYSRGEVISVQVHPDFQHKGIATAMVDASLQNKYRPHIRNSPTKTTKGAAFAKFVEPAARATFGKK